MLGVYSSLLSAFNICYYYYFKLPFASYCCVVLITNQPDTRPVHYSFSKGWIVKNTCTDDIKIIVNKYHVFLHCSRIGNSCFTHSMYCASLILWNKHYKSEGYKVFYSLAFCILYYSIAESFFIYFRICLNFVFFISFSDAPALHIVIRHCLQGCWHLDTMNIDVFVHSIFSTFEWMKKDGHMVHLTSICGDSFILGCCSRMLNKILTTTSQLHSSYKTPDSHSHRLLTF